MCMPISHVCMCMYVNVWICVFVCEHCVTWVIVSSHCWILTFSAFYSCAFCQWDEKLHEETFLRSGQCCGACRGPALATWHPQAHHRESFRALRGPAGRKPQLPGLQDRKCQLVPEPRQRLLCEPLRWPRLAGATARQPIPIRDVQGRREGFLRQ